MAIEEGPGTELTIGTVGGPGDPEPVVEELPIGTRVTFELTGTIDDYNTLRSRAIITADDGSQHFVPIEFVKRA